MSIETRRLAGWLAWGQLEVDTAEGREARAYPVVKMAGGRLFRFGESNLKDTVRLGLHRVPVPVRLHAQALREGRVEVAYCYLC